MRDQTEETFYLVRYALSEGAIAEVRSVESHSSKGWVSVSANGYWTSFKLGRDIFRDRNDALTQVEAMRKKKIASLQKQIQRLEGMEIK